MTVVQLRKSEELELTSDQLFEMFWSRYPKRVEKKEARGEWKKLTSEQQYKALEAVDKYAATVDDPHFILYPHRWLKRERFEDEYETPVVTSCRWPTCGSGGKHQHGTASYCEKHFLALKRGESPGR